MLRCYVLRDGEKIRVVASGVNSINFTTTLAAKGGSKAIVSGAEVALKSLGGDFLSGAFEYHRRHRGILDAAVRMRRKSVLDTKKPKTKRQILRFALSESSVREVESVKDHNLNESHETWMENNVAEAAERFGVVIKESKLSFLIYAKGSPNPKGLADATKWVLHNFPGVVCEQTKEAVRKTGLPTTWRETVRCRPPEKRPGFFALDDSALRE
jgi:hypothetical protein